MNTVTHRNIRNSAEPLIDLQVKLAELADRSTEVVNRADAEGRQLTPVELESLEATHGEFERITAEIEQRGRVDAMHRATTEPVNRQAQPPLLPVPSDAPGARPDHRQARNGVLLPPNCRSATAMLFARAPDPFAGNAERFFHAVANRLMLPELLRNSYGNEGSGADGGFAVPPGWFNGLVDQALEASELASRCRLYPTATSSVALALPDYQNRASDLAGLESNWSGEGQTMNAQAMKFRQVNIKAHKIALLAQASAELAEDGLNYATQLNNALTTTAAYQLDSAIISGNGVGKPLGIINSPSAISVAAESGQAAATINFVNIVNLYSRLAPACQKRGVWFINPGVLPQLLLMSFPTSGGSTVPVLLGSGNATNAAAGEPVGTILGRPVVVSEIVPQLGNAGDIIFADLTEYALVMRNSARIEMNLGPGFAQDIISWRLIWRVGGQPMMNVAISPYSGGATLSWAAYLAARS